MSKPTALDLFCGAGGASMGLYRAGFDVTGVDITPQKNYPFHFVQADALDYPLDGFDFIWASPPCQAYSKATKRWSSRNHIDVVDITRMRLTAAWIKCPCGCDEFLCTTHWLHVFECSCPPIENWNRSPYSSPAPCWAIENVSGAPLRVARKLCGSAFGLGVRRHRFIETNVDLPLLYPCDHSKPVAGVYGHTGGQSRRDKRQFGSIKDWRVAMDIHWMTVVELSQSVPPAYSEFIGKQAIQFITQVSSNA